MTTRQLGYIVVGLIAMLAMGWIVLATAPNANTMFVYI
jgi:hypothetical protein